MGGRKNLCNSRIGTTFEAKRWLSLDVCGMLGVSCSWGVHLFAYVTTACFLIEGSLFANAVFLLLYTPVTFLALASLYMAWTTDPGAVPMGARPLVTVKRAVSGEITPTNGSCGRGRALRRCHKCNDNFKAPRAHHDSVTGRCIVKFDHFCPWVGNAIGALNHKFFVLFVGYTMCSCLSTLFLMILRAIHCGVLHKPDDTEGAVDSKGANAGLIDADQHEMSNVTDSVEDSNLLRLLSTSSDDLGHPTECTGWFQSTAVLALLIASVIFLIFTCCMLVEQIEAIETNASKIARMKMRVGQAGTELARVTEEFNEMFGGDRNEVTWQWFLPMPVEFPQGMRKVVLGYEWDETFDPVPYEEDSLRSNGNNVSGGIGDEEEGVGGAAGNGRIELTNTAHPASSSIADGAGEEANFTATPVTADKPKLTKRANSRGPDGRSHVSKGALT